MPRVDAGMAHALCGDCCWIYSRNHPILLRVEVLVREMSNATQINAVE